MKNIWLVFASMLILLCLTSTSIAGINVDGAIIREEISPGQHFQKTVEIGIGANDTETSFNVSLAGYGQTIYGGNIKLEPSEQTSFMANFLTATPVMFDCKPGEKQTITVSGDIPEDVGVGGKFALLNVKSKPFETDNKNVNIVLAVDIPILLTIKDSDQNLTGEITNLKIADTVTPTHQNFTAIINNTGNNYYMVQSKAELKDSTSKVVAEVTNPLGGSPTVPPNAKLLYFNIAPQTALIPGKYNLTVTVSLEDGTVLATKDTSVEIK